jgi:ABC-type transport system involved in cytochrome c biogenesis permease subunit
LRHAAAALPGRIETVVKRLAESPPEAHGTELEQIRVRLRATAAGAADLVRLTGELHLALYDNGHAMAVVPALNAAALDRDRDVKEEAQPWLSLQTVLFGSDALMRDYPQPELAAVRRAFQEAADVYTNREDPGRAERLGPALERFAVAVRALGEGVEPLRQSLPIRHKKAATAGRAGSGTAGGAPSATDGRGFVTPDEALLAATRYPPAGTTDLEVLYNRVEPFMWTWILSLAGTAGFSLALGRYRTLMFWLAMLLVSAGQGFAIFGLAVRTAITGRAPVTNMFETVVFVALVVALLGLWFTLLPLTGRGLRAAWQWAAVPGTWEAPALGKEELALWSERTWRMGHWVFLAPRAILAYVVFAACALTPYGEGQGSTAIGLWPRTDVGASMPAASDLIVWMVGLSVLVLCVWYIPRAVVALAASLFTVPYVLATQGVRRPLAQVVGRKPFALAGAAVAFLTAYLACYAPIFDQNISPLMPVLRHNFWLTSHVLTICASYGAGALAWALGNLALAYYLGGRYRNPAFDPLPADIVGEHRPAGNYHVSPEALTRHAPEPCNTLGTYIYRATQVAVLFLAAGTILGALWADVSWGRFWGWDPKEVWALVSLLVYLAVLHGRYAGWFGNFGLAVGSVFGATAIMMAWYGVNFYLGSGKHTYGEGTGGFIWVLSAVLLNWGFVLAAAVRYHVEVRMPSSP